MEVGFVRQYSAATETATLLSLASPLLDPTTERVRTFLDSTERPGTRHCDRDAGLQPPGKECYVRCSRASTKAPPTSAHIRSMVSPVHERTCDVPLCKLGSYSKDDYIAVAAEIKKKLDTSCFSWLLRWISRYAESIPKGPSGAMGWRIQEPVGSCSYRDTSSRYFEIEFLLSGPHLLWGSP